MTTSPKPTISVVISTYKRAKDFLPRALASVINQTIHEPYEIIVVDDCSPDNTKEVVAQIADKLDNKYIVDFTYYRLKENSGSDTKPKNHGVALAKGQYIAYLDDDCEWYTYHLEVLMEAFRQDPKLDVAYCDMELYYPGASGAQKAITYDFDSQFLFRRNYIDTSEVMHKRELIFKVGGWNETLPKFVDWNLWVRMRKAGGKFRRVPIIATKYYVHEEAKSAKIKTKSWVDPDTGITMFEPTFKPSGDYIYLPYLGNDRKEEIMPRVAIYTVTYDRLDYTKRMWESLKKSTKYPFTWCVFDNGSTDGTVDWVPKQTKFWSGAGSNKGISYASNHLLDLIQDKIKPQIIIKVDNDCEFRTMGWLEDIVDLWKRNHFLYMSPYPEGLVHNPGGGPRVGHSYIGPFFVEVAQHIGGLCAAIDASAYNEFRFQDKFLHGNQDWEASQAFRKMGYMPMYIPMHRVMHMDTTEGQHEKYPEYFERRKTEKTTQVSPV